MSDEIISQVNDDTFLITSQKFEKDSIQQAVYDYQSKSNFRSTYFNETNGMVNFKIEDIDNLAYNAQSNLLNIIKINNIIRYFVNKDSILGKVYEAIEANLNPDWQLSYPKYTDEDREIYDTVDALIKDFNEKIDLDNLIVESIPMAYLEGNYTMYLRKDVKNNNYHVDNYPLGVCEIADYNEGGEPYLLISIKELESRLRKVYKKNKKNKALFYENIDEEIKNTYPPEVYKAFKEKEQYAILDIRNSGLMRVNNLKRKYGLSPIFKSLKHVIRLENVELSDDRNTLVRGKKIIFQKLIKELVTQSKDMPNIGWAQAQAKSHFDLMSALNQDGISVFTAPPWSDSIEYIESKIEPTNVQVKNNYKNQIMTAVGIAYLSADKGSFGAAQVSIAELLKVINSISRQLETILEKWYRGILTDNNIEQKYCPKIKIIDSEKLNTELSMQLARMLNTELNASLTTTYDALGLDIETEARLRKIEIEKGYEDIFKPRMTAFTNNGESNDDAGRPSNSKDRDKQEYDNDYNNENGR